MKLRHPKKYRLAILSFLFGVMVIASIGATATLVWADSTLAGKSTASFVPGGCAGGPAMCAPQSGELISKIIPMCDMLCCNYTLDAFIQLAINIATFILGISGSVALLMVVLGGFQYLTSAGDKGKVTKGTETMVNAAIGLVIVFTSWMAVNFVMTSLIKKETGDKTLAGRLGGIFNGTSKWSYQADICTPIHFGTIGVVPEIQLAQTQAQSQGGCYVTYAEASAKALQMCGAGKFEFSTGVGAAPYCYHCKDESCTSTDHFIANSDCGFGSAVCDAVASNQTNKNRVFVSSYLITGNKCCCVLPIKLTGQKCEVPPMQAQCAGTQYCTNPNDPANGTCELKKNDNEACTDPAQCKTGQCTAGKCGAPVVISNGVCCVSYNTNGSGTAFHTSESISSTDCQNKAFLDVTIHNKFYCPNATSCGTTEFIGMDERWKVDCPNAIIY